MCGWAIRKLALAATNAHTAAKPGGGLAMLGPCPTCLRPTCLPGATLTAPSLLFRYAAEEEEGEGGGVFYDEDEVLAGAAAASLGVGDVEEVRA